MSDFVTYKETTNSSITFKYSSSSGNVGQLLYSKNVLKTTEFLAMHSKKSLFQREKNLKYNHNLKRVQKQQLFVPFHSYIWRNSIHRYAASVKLNSRYSRGLDIPINFQETRHVYSQNCNNIRIICSHVNTL